MQEVRAPRRLPTKTRSGTITLPPPQSSLNQPGPLVPINERARAAQIRLAECQQALKEQQQQQSQPDETHAQGQPSSPAYQSDIGQQSASQAVRGQDPPLIASSQAWDPGVSTPPVTLTVPRPVLSSRHKHSLTGTLNRSTMPETVSLPVVRRGSYQGLKRHTPAEVAAAGQESNTIRQSHWERFGTVMGECFVYLRANSRLLMSVLPAPALRSGLLCFLFLQCCTWQLLLQMMCCSSCRQR